VTGISTSDIAGIQACVTSLLPDTATIRRSTGQASDGQGGVSGTLTVIATSPVLVSDRRETADEMVGTERVESVVGWILTFPAGTDVTAKDDVTVGTRTFQVLGILSGSYETDRRAVCAEATP
jgi:hypothetical protein